MRANDAEIERALTFARQQVGVCEDPIGSNRGPEIDAWATEFGSPLGSSWCALAVGKARKEGGLWIPTQDVGSCDEWVYQATRDGLLVTDPVPGAAVVYTNHNRIASGRYEGQLDAVHIGLTRLAVVVHLPTGGPAGSPEGVAGCGAAAGCGAG